MIVERYFINKEYHREDGPALRKWNDHGVLIEETWLWKSLYSLHTFGIMQTNLKLSYKRGKEVAMKDLIKAGKIILRFMKKSKLIKRRYGKIIESSIWWSFPGLGKILLELNGRI